MQYETSVATIVSQNVNGMKASEGMSSCAVLGDSARERGVDIICAIETCVDWSRESVVRQATEQFRRHFNEQIRLSHSSSEETYGSAYQPGGTATIVGGDWVGRTTTSSDTSGMGRWSEARLRGKDDTAVNIITAYRVVDTNHAMAGPTTAYSQQFEALKDKKVLNPNPRAAMLHDLGQRIKELRASNEEVILCIDANESLQDQNDAFAKWVRKHELIDIMVARHGTEDEPATHARGSKRIDYILMTEMISEFVTAAGILELCDFHESDHRAMYVDVDLERYLGAKPSPLEANANRGLMSSDPNAVKLYREYVASNLDQHEIEKKMDEFDEKLKEGGGILTVELADVIDELEEKFTSIKLDGEKACKRQKRYPWSPKLRDARNKVRFWKLWLMQLRRSLDLAEQRSKIDKNEKRQFKKDDLPKVQRELRKAQKDLRNLLKNARKIRRDHLRHQARMAAYDGRETEAAAISRLERAEEQKVTYRRLQHAMGKGKKNGLTHVLIEKEDGTLECILDRKEMTKAILGNHVKQMGQANGTAFTVSPLCDIFGRYGTNELADAVFRGMTEEDLRSLSTLDGVIAILRALKRPGEVTEIDDIITAEDLRQAYRRWRESTSTSPSGLHLGHEKALFKYEEKETSDGELRLSDRIFRIKARFLNIAIKHGHVYKRWMKVVNATIEKIPGKPLLHKLRVIHLIESDFNVMIGILWGRRLMALAEEMNAFGEEQMGGRKDHSAQETLAQKQCIYSIMRMARYSGATFDNDAKSCYDRIVMLVASLCSQRQGMTKAACEIFLKTLDKVKYHVKTNLGISDESYGTTSDATMHGPGQGGRGSPAIWTTISCLIMECLQERSDGIEISGPEVGKDESSTRIRSTGFVDDVTLWMGNFARDVGVDSQADHTTIIEEMETAARWWEEVLAVTGGKLELSKCFFYLIYWVFNEEGEPRMIEPEELTRPIQIVDSTSGQVYRIETKSCGVAHKTLGCMECPNGDYSAESKRLKEKAKSITRRVHCSKLNRHEATTLYFTMIKPSMLYSAPAGTLTKEEAKEIDSCISQAMLPKMGYCTKTPLAVVYGPKHLGGLGMTDTFTKQTAAKALFILRHVRANKNLGKSMVAQWQWAQLVSGMSRSILRHPEIPVPQLDGERYIKTLREGLAAANCGISLTDVKPVQMKRENDKAIMDVTLDGKFEGGPVIVDRINRCRMYMRVETVSDICDATGTYIEEKMMQCDSKARANPKTRWPNQTEPGKESKKEWRKMLNMLCKDGSNELITPLGKWLDDGNITEKKWPVMVSKRGGRLYAITEEDEYLTVAMGEKDRRGIRPAFSQDNTYEVCDYARGIPVRIGKDAEGYFVSDPNDFATSNIETSGYNYEEEQEESVAIGSVEEGSSSSSSSSSDSSDSEALTGGIGFQYLQSWAEYLEDAPLVEEWERQVLEGIDLDDEEKRTRLMHLLNDKHACLKLASDGGVRDGSGSFGWTMSLDGEYIDWSHKGRARGSKMTSYRAEAYGMLAWILFLKHVRLFTSVRINCKIEPFCDNEALVKEIATLRTTETASECLKPEYDLITMIHKELNWVMNQCDNLQAPKHVKGHQDEVTPWEELSVQAKLNVKADDLATVALEKMFKKDTILPAVENGYCKAYLYNGKELLTRDEKWTLTTKMRELTLQAYYMKSVKVDRDTIEDVNWAGLRIARDKMTTSERFFHSKQSIGWLPTGERTKKYGSLVTNCQRCGGEETVEHILNCPDNMDMKLDMLGRLRTFLGKIKTDDETKESILEGVQAFLDNVTIAKRPYRRNETRQEKAMRMQGNIGWKMFMRGWLSNEWAKIQDERNDDGKLKGTGDGWSSKVSLWMIREARRFWLERNGEQPADAEPGSKRTRADAEADARVRRIYERRNDVAEEDQKLFDVPIEERLAWSARNKMLWAKKTTSWLNVQKARKAAREEMKQPDIRKAMAKAAATAEKERADKERRAREEPSENEDPTTTPSERELQGETEQLDNGLPTSPMSKAWGSLRRGGKTKGKEKKVAAKKKTTTKKKRTKAVKKANKQTEAAQRKTTTNEEQPAAIEMIHRARLPKFKRTQGDDEPPNDNKNVQVARTSGQTDP